MNQEEIQALISESLPTVRQRLKVEVETRLLREAFCQLDAQLRKVVIDLVTEEFVPELKEALIGEKAKLREAALTASSAIAQTIGTAVAATLADKMKNSWDRKKILDALFC